MTNWKEYKLGKVIETVSKTFKFSDKKVVFLNTSDTLEGKVINHNLFDPKKLPGQAKKTIQPNDILYSEIRPENKRFAFVDFDSSNYVVSTKLMVLRVLNKEIISPKYLYYFLTSDEIVSYLQMLAESRSGTFPQIRFEEVSLLDIKLPPLIVQNKIVELVASLDDKIELNNKINQELENLAQTLFKQWFIDFEFPNQNGEPYKSSGGEMIDSELGEIPEGWEVGVLDDILEVKGGTTPSTKEPSYWDGDFHWTSPRDLSNLQFPVLIDTDKKVTTKGLKKISSGLLPKGTLLLSSRAPIGYLAITEIETAINQGYIAINGREGLSNIYILYWLKLNMNSVIERANGSTFLEISKTNFKQINCIIPSFQILNNYIWQVEILFEQLKSNLLENQELTNLRDTLLPKLISGELEVKKT